MAEMNILIHFETIILLSWNVDKIDVFFATRFKHELQATHSNITLIPSMNGPLLSMLSKEPWCHGCTRSDRHYRSCWIFYGRFWIKKTLTRLTWKGCLQINWFQFSVGWCCVIASKLLFWVIPFFASPLSSATFVFRLSINSKTWSHKLALRTTKTSNPIKIL